MQDAIAVSLAQNNGGELLSSPDSRSQCSGGERELMHTSIVNISTIDNRTISPFIDDSTPTPSPTAHRFANVTSPVEDNYGLDEVSTTVTTDSSRKNSKTRLSNDHVEI